MELLFEDPIQHFFTWYQQAVQRQVTERDTIALATCSSIAKPSVRLVLYKGLSQGKFTFFTNYESRKAREMKENPFASILFFWPPLMQQIRIEGVIEKMSEGESDRYWRTRPLESQLTATCSAQSFPITGRSELETKIQHLRVTTQGTEIPRPDFWGGYLLRPLGVEFWQGQDNRFHDRLQYIFREDKKIWTKTFLAP